MFAETRLRRGVYGQRYDNGQRHDGEKTQALDVSVRATSPRGPRPCGTPRACSGSRSPWAGSAPTSWRRWPISARSTSDGILHVTTRQDIQLHFVHIEDTPDLMRRLAAVGITTREACGNTVRNVTACHLAGVCKTEAFDVAPYAHAMTYFLLGHDDTQDFGRKFKVAFSGCHEEACGLTNFHDVGLIARTRVVDGQEQRGFGYYVGGGLGAVPFAAQLMEEFLPEEELLPLTQAIARVFAPHGREGQARPGPAEVPGEEAGLRGVQAARAARSGPAAEDRPALDGVPGGSARDRREAAASGRSGDAADPGRGSGRLGPDQRARRSGRRATGW